jgi:hypothetical protein
MESVRFHVRPIDIHHLRIPAIESAFRGTLTNLHSYNKYLSVAARVVRRSLKDDKRIAAERRGEMELRFAKWNVSALPPAHFTKEDFD